MTVTYSRIYRPKIKLTQRPERFTLNRRSPLYRGLVFAGLGSFPNRLQVHDSSPFGNHGTCTNMSFPSTATSGWTWVPELGRWGLVFDGANDNVALANGLLSGSFIASNFSIAAWVNCVALRRIVNAYNPVSPYNGLAWDLLTDGSSRITRGGSPYWGTSNTGLLTTGAWYHVAWTIAGTSASFYVNGKLDKAVSVGSAGAAWTGANLIGLASGGYHGTLADFAFASRDWSAVEISVFADRSDAMLSGLIVEPKRELFPVAYVPTYGTANKYYPVF